MAEIATEIDDGGFTDMPVGEILRRTRIHYDQSIEDIERALRIRAEQIEAIEEGDLARLPGKVYAIGFVRSYSEFLGLDGDKMVNLFKHQAAGQAVEPELHFPIPASDSHFPPWWVILACVVGVIAILFMWFGEATQERKIVEDIPPVPKEMQVAETSSSSPAQQIQNNAEPVAEEEQVIEEKPVEGIILNIRQNSWVEIRDKKGKAMLSRVLKAGDQYYVPDRPDLTISIGNAGGVEIEVDGQKLKKLGEKGQVLRRLSLDAEYLKKNFALENAQ